MKTISFDLTFDQVLALMACNVGFRNVVANKLFAAEVVTLDDLLRKAIEANSRNKIGAIKALRASVLEYPHITKELPQNDFGQLGLAAAKNLIDLNWERFGGQ